VDVLLALILSCSVHFDDHLVEALATKLSVGNQYFVGDLSNLNTYDTAHSVPEARKIVDDVLAKGGRPAVGYLAVPVTWAPRFGRTVDDLFDGCVNIGIATAMLSEYEHACTIGPVNRRHARARPGGRRRTSYPPALRYCILRRLEIDLDITGVVDHVLPEIAKLDRKPIDLDTDSAPARAPLYPDKTDSARLHESADWSNQRLFFSSPTAPSKAPPAPVAVGASPHSPRSPPSSPAESVSRLPSAPR
jgi:hypothetical protein